MLNRRDVCVTGILLAGCATLYYVTTGFEEVSALLGQNVLPEQFPRLLLWIIGGLALLLPFEHKFQPQRWRKIDEVRSRKIPQRTWISIGFVMLIVVIAPLLGTVLTMGVICIALPLLWGERRWKLILPFAVFFTALVTYLFNSVLKVYFEPGLLGAIVSLVG